MTCYINPPNGVPAAAGVKEAWLADEATSLPGCPYWVDVPDGQLPIVFIDSGAFTAAAVAFDEQELRRLSQRDGRPRRYFLASVSKLLKVAPTLHEELTRDVG